MKISLEVSSDSSTKNIEIIFEEQDSVEINLGNERVWASKTELIRLLKALEA